MKDTSGCLKTNPGGQIDASVVDQYKLQCFISANRHMDRQMDIQMKTLIKRFEDASKNLLRLEKNILGKKQSKAACGHDARNQSSVRRTLGHP